MLEPREALTRRAAQVVTIATQRLHGALGEGSGGVSVGVLGSYARGDLSHTSDIDYYVVFDRRQLPANYNVAQLEQIVLQTVAGVRRVRPDEPLAARFSVFWSTLEALQKGDYSVGRWPAYDRQALIEDGRHLAGFRLSTKSLPRVTHEELLEDAVHLLINVLRPRVTASGLLSDSWTPEEALQGAGAPLVTKAILMPIRLLYMLQNASSHRMIASTEQAVSCCRARHGCAHWWPLAENALQWRRGGPTVASEGAGSQRSLLVALYLQTIADYAPVAETLGLSDRAETLLAWHSELAKPREVGQERSG